MENIRFALPGGLSSQPTGESDARKLSLAHGAKAGEVPPVLGGRQSASVAFVAVTRVVFLQDLSARAHLGDGNDGRERPRSLRGLSLR